MLTRKQYDLLMFIHDRIQSDGVSPSFDEMKDALELKSKSGIHRLITALEERGYIRRLPHRARALEVLRLPENVASDQASVGRAPSAGPSLGGPHLSVVSGAKSAPVVGRGGRLGAARDAGRDERERERSGEVPVIGRIAAGAPIEALQNPLNSVDAPSAMLAPGAEHFALEVRGDSMIDAGIHDGDIVVIRKQATAANGDVVVALVDDSEATLKRLRRKGGVVALEAANAAYETRVYGADQVKVQGRLVGLIRIY